MATPTPSSENASFLKASAISNYDPVTRPLKGICCALQTKRDTKGQQCKEWKERPVGFCGRRGGEVSRKRFHEENKFIYKRKDKGSQRFMNKAVPPLVDIGATGGGDLHVAAANLEAIR